MKVRVWPHKHGPVFTGDALLVSVELLVDAVLQDVAIGRFYKMDVYVGRVDLRNCMMLSTEHHPHYRLLLCLERRVCNTRSSCNGSFCNRPSFFFLTCNYNSLQ